MVSTVTPRCWLMKWMNRAAAIAISSAPTPAASGKTYCYNLPVLHRLLVQAAADEGEAQEERQQEDQERQDREHDAERPRQQDSLHVVGKRQVLAVAIARVELDTVGERIVLIGDYLNIPQLAQITFKPDPGGIGAIGSFDFNVMENRGGYASGSIPITVTQSNRPPAS